MNKALKSMARGGVTIPVNISSYVCLETDFFGCTTRIQIKNFMKILIWIRKEDNLGSTALNFKLVNLPVPV
jgi:hypothetical protein